MNTTPSPASRAAAVYLSTTPDCLTPSAAVGSSKIKTRAPKYTARNRDALPLTAGQGSNGLIDVLDDDAHLAQFLVGDALHVLDLHSG